MTPPHAQTGRGIHGINGTGFPGFLDSAAGSSSGVA
jgi:hypothetical protein